MAMFNSYVKLPEGISSEMWVKQCHKAPIFLGMVLKKTPMAIWGMVYGIVLPTLIIISHPLITIINHY